MRHHEPMGFKYMRRVDPAGAIRTFAGTGSEGFSGDGGPAAQAELAAPHGVAVNEAGSVYIAEYRNSRVRRVAGTGTITTLAGTGESSYGGDGGPAAN